MISLVAFSCKAEDAEKFYIGFGVGAADYNGDYQGISFVDSPSAAHGYVAYRFSDSWSLELALERWDDAESGIIAGSGIETLKLSDRIDSTSIRVLRFLPLSEVLGWQQDIEIFGMLGGIRFGKEMNILQMSADQVTDFTRDDVGLMAGGGIQYNRRRLSFRGYVQWLDVGDRDQMTDLGISIEWHL